MQYCGRAGACSGPATHVGKGSSVPGRDVQPAGFEGRGIVGYGAYIPHHRLSRAAIGAVLGSGGGKGARAAASYDEDTTTMGVEAARVATRGLSSTPATLFFATSVPAYLDKTNATAIHAALDLGRQGLAVDVGGGVRSGVGALYAAAHAGATAVAVVSDQRGGLPGGADERDGGDGAAAFVFGDGSTEPIVAELLAEASTTAEFLDRWRLPGEPASRTWEERFGERVYAALAADAFDAALKQAGIDAGSVDHLIVAGLHARAVRSVTAATGVAAESIAPDLTTTIGNAGLAQAGIALSDVLDRAGPGEIVVVVVLADGASVLVLRTTDALANRRSAPTVAAQIAAGSEALSYATFLTWRGLLDREPPRRPEPPAPAAPPAFRNERWKYAFVASRCSECGTRHLPPDRVCVACGAVDHMAPEAMADVTGRVATFAVDYLAFSPSPPYVAVVVDFDGGGRFRFQLTDADASNVAIGDRVALTFRRLATSEGVHNYFWKVRPSTEVA